MIIFQTFFGRLGSLTKKMTHDLIRFRSFTSHTHSRVESIRVALMDGGCPETERWGRGRCGRLGRE